MNIEKTLNKAIVFLKQHNVKNPHLDSEILLSKIINKDRKYIILNSKENLKDKDLNNFNVLIDRRRKGEPIAYLVNNKEFWSNPNNGTSTPPDINGGLYGKKKVVYPSPVPMPPNNPTNGVRVNYYVAK